MILQDETTNDSNIFTLKNAGDFITFCNDIYHLFMSSLTHCATKIQFVTVFLTQLSKKCNRFEAFFEHIKATKNITLAMKNNAIAEAFAFSEKETQINEIDGKLMKMFLQSYNEIILSYAKIGIINSVFEGNNDLEKNFNFSIYGKGHVLTQCVSIASNETVSNQAQHPEPLASESGAYVLPNVQGFYLSMILYCY